MLAVHDTEDFHIKQSLAILEYLEDITATDTAAGKHPSLRGRTPIERAKVRQLLQTADSAFEQFGIAVRHGSKLMAYAVGRGSPNSLAARFAICAFHEKFNLIESYADPLTNGSAMLVDFADARDHVSLADCVTFAFYDYIKNMYGADVFAAGRHERLRVFYKEFEKRSSAVLRGDYPKELQELGKQWADGGDLWAEACREQDPSRV